MLYLEAGFPSGANTVVPRQTDIVRELQFVECSTIILKGIPNERNRKGTEELSARIRQEFAKGAKVGSIRGIIPAATKEDDLLRYLGTQTQRAGHNLLVSLNWPDEDINRIPQLIERVNTHSGAKGIVCRIS